MYIQHFNTSKFQTIEYFFLQEMNLIIDQKIKMLIGSAVFSYAIVDGPNTIIRGNLSAMKTIFEWDKYRGIYTREYQR